MAPRQTPISTRQIKNTKATGAHYTPPALAQFLASRALNHLQLRHGLRVLDPACGDGNLLHAFVELCPVAYRKSLEVIGFESDRCAAGAARGRLSAVPDLNVKIEQADFLEELTACTSRQGNLFETPRAVNRSRVHPPFDLIIANPPYVRTQVLGADTSQRLATTLNLSGRVDLYHAFVRAMTLFLQDDGVLALLCSNRFLSTLSGASVRETLSSNYQVHEVIDLGDTKLFAAAVLPAIVIAHKRESSSKPHTPRFLRIYETAPVSLAPPSYESALHALETGATDIVAVGAIQYRIERGVLGTTARRSDPWVLTSKRHEAWLAQVEAHSDSTFDEAAVIRVGIKTTADPVFVRSDWNGLPPTLRPEPSLLRPLLTHHSALRWVALPPRYAVLYPHRDEGGRATPIDLSSYPQAEAYLKAHKKRLSARRYVTEAGRRWYELWVPQRPAEWAKPKVVFPDIAETPRFFLDESGAIVNGDCYWLTLRPGVDHSMLMLMLAIANSSLALRFYDNVCGNRLYSGRRRFITQYVKQFPLPRCKSVISRSIIGVTRKLLEQSRNRPADVSDLERELDHLVWQSFGFSEEIRG